jgi:hypothetical protein
MIWHEVPGDNFHGAFVGFDQLPCDPIDALAQVGRARWRMAHSACPRGANLRAFVELTSSGRAYLSGGETRPTRAAAVVSTDRMRISIRLSQERES